MKTKLSATAQHKLFLETARKLECDEDKARFEDRLARIATAKLPKKKKRKTTRTRKNPSP